MKKSKFATKLIINNKMCNDKSDGFRRLVEKCNLNNLFDVIDEDLEAALRDDFKASSVVRNRSIAKELGNRKLSGLRKHQLIDAVISWGYEQGGREGELRRMGLSDLVELGNMLGVRIYLPINMDDVVSEFLEASINIGRVKRILNMQTLTKRKERIFKCLDTKYRHSNSEVNPLFFL